MKPVKYFIYTRRSTEDDSKQVQSLETQERILLEYAKSRGLEIVEIFKESKSARSDGNRPLFSEMVKRIIDGEASGILVAHIDRLSRNSTEVGLLEKLYASHSLEVISTPGRDYSSVSDQLYIGFDFVLAAHYSRALSERVREGISTKLSKGEHLGVAPPGYLNTKGKITIDPLLAPHIQKAFQLYSSGSYTLTQIRDFLYDNGYRSRYTARKVPKASIHNILSNPTYYGAIRSKGIIYKGIHEPLINKTIYDQVQLVLEGKNRSHKIKHDFLFRPFLKCGSCGCQVTATLAKGKYAYYYCTNGKKYAWSIRTTFQNKKYSNY